MTVPPERLARWLDGFAARHGSPEVRYDGPLVRLDAADGAVAEVEVPFPPLEARDAPASASCQKATGPEPPEAPTARLVEHALRPRTVGVLLVRLGGYAAGVFEDGRLVASKTGSRPVHGRAAAGGWSQQRFARRREGQAAVALGAAADAAAAVLLGRPLDAVVLGGDRSAVDTVLADRRLEPLRALVRGRLLDVPDPRRAVLESARYRDVWIRVQEPVTSG